MKSADLKIPKARIVLTNAFPVTIVIGENEFEISEEMAKRALSKISTHESSCEPPSS